MASKPLVSHAMSKRLPLTGAYNTRQASGTIVRTTGVVGFAVCGIAIVGNSFFVTSKTTLTANVAVVGFAVVGIAIVGNDFSKDHRLVNRLQITQSDPIGGTKRLYVVKRPGFSGSIQVRPGHVGNAIHVWAGQGAGDKPMSAFGNTDFKLYDNITEKGSGTGKATGITESKISDIPTLFITSSDNKGWLYQDAASLTQIADVDFPGNAARVIVGTFVHLDGYAFIMDSGGRIYNSDLNSGTGWTAASYITANSVPDVGIGLARSGELIIGFCKTHFDVFKNAGNATGSPLVRIDGQSQMLGCVSARAMTMLRDTIYFMGSTKGASLALYAYAGGVAKAVSTPEQNTVFAVAGPSRISVTQLGFFGRHFIVVCASTSTHVYCVEENTWHEWTGRQVWAMAAGLASEGVIVNYSVSPSSDSGKLYVLNPDLVVYRDDGKPIPALVQTTKWDGGTNKRKFIEEVVVIGDQESQSELLHVSYSDDDYQTWTPARTVDMSNENPKIQRVGSTRHRSFRLADSADSAMRLEALDVTFTPGSL